MIKYALINKYLLSLLITIMGLLFSVIPLLYSSSFSIFFPGILLLIVPVVYLLIFIDDDLKKYDEIFLLILILITIAYIYYIFAFKFYYPIGTDAPAHLASTKSLLVESGHIIFDNKHSPSSAFPGLYILYTFLMNITDLDLYPLAAYLHPALNMLTFVFFYIFLQKFYDAKNSLLAVFLCGWEHNVFKFGFEYRTQSLAVILYMAVILLCSMRISSNKSYNVYSTVTLLFLTAGITTIHFVTNVTLILTLLVLATSSLIISKIGGNVDIKISFTFIIFSFILLVAYMLYLSQSIDGIVGFLKYSITQSLSNEFVGASTSKTEGLWGYIYGPLVLLVTWLTRFIFILSSFIFVQKSVLKTKKLSDLFMILWAGMLIALMSYISLQGYELNPGRLYNFFAFPFSIIVSFGIFSFLRTKSLKIRPYIKAFTLIFILLFVISSILKLPSSIIGDTEPLRGYHPVEDQRWDVGRNDYKNIGASTIDIVKENKIYCDSNFKDKG